MVGVCRHEARQDVRLTEVAQTPGHQGDDGDHVQVLEHVEVAGALGRHFHHGAVDAAHGDDDEHRGEDQGEDHQGRLHRVGPAHREETAEEGIGDGGCGTDPEGGVVIHAEGALEQAGTGHYAGGAVDGEEQQDHQGREDAQHLAVILEAVGEVIRQGQGVAVLLGVDPQAAGHPAPVEISADDQTDGDPALWDAADEDCAWQAHQQPAAHVGSTGGEGGDPAPHAAAAEDVVVEIAGGAIGDKTDQHHPEDVHQEGD